MRSLPFLLGILVPSLAAAATIHVPGDQPTIQAGINTAAPGDTVLIAAGTFTGAGNKNMLLNKDVVVRSASGASQTIIDCEGTGRAFIIAATAARISGLTMRNGNPMGGGGAVLCSVASPFLSQCVFEDNVAVGFIGNGGGAVLCLESSPTFEDCVFVGNENPDVNGIGGGISSKGCTALTVRRCVFESNSANGGGGGLVSDEDDIINIIGCMFRGNSRTGVIILNGGDARVDETAFVENVGGEGGGLSVVRTPVVLTGALFDRNAAVRGTAIYLRNNFELEYEVQIDRCTLWRNEVTGTSVLDIDSLTEITSSLFAQNLGQLIWFCPNFVLECCDFYDNSGGDNSCIDGQVGINGNFSADPLFCDADNGNFTLAAESPCLPGNHPDGVDCGLIGALGQGCSPVAVEQETWAGIKSRYRAAER